MEEEKEERRKQIKFLRRQENRNKRLPDLLAGLSPFVDEIVTEKNVLTLEQIDWHETELNSSDFDFTYLNISFPREKADELQKIISVLSSELNTVNYLSFHEWAEIAVLKLNTSFVIRNVSSLIALDGDSFYVYTLNYQSGIWVDLYRDYWYLEGEAKLREILELRVFGKEWMKKVASAL